MVGITGIAWLLAGSLEVAPAPTWDGFPEPTLRREGAIEAGPLLATPWMCEQTEYCTQGHNGGSHTGSGAWAWDFSLQLGEEIWAASAGTVTHIRTDSTSGGCDQAYVDDANYVVVDHGDGTSILYLHVLANSSPLSVGETVEVGDLVARVGETGWACGAHLHLQVMETCGGSYCNSLQASFADHGDPAASTQYTSTNCPTCGIALAGGETVIDDEDAGCFVRETTAWSSSYTGHGEHHFVTLATDAAAPESIGTWLFVVTTPGDYRVEVHVPDADAGTTNAVYQVVHADGTDMVAIDQSTQKGWQELGTFPFAGGGSESIVLPDNTGESLDLAVPIGYDAVRFTYVPSSGDETGGEDSSGEAGTGSGPDDGSTSASGSATSTTNGGSSPSTTDAGSDTDPTFAGPDALPPSRGSDDDGCACAHRPSAPPLFAWILLALALRRRRRPHGGTAHTPTCSCSGGAAPRGHHG